jgi:FlaG/FlaF family flagellin (archaellin)
MTPKAKNSLRGDTRGVSPVIGVIMMIAVVTLIAAFVAAVAYGVIGGVSEVPCVALVEEGVGGGTNVTVTITHYGGDFVSGAFTTIPCSAEPGDKWQNLELKYNGAKVSSSNANNIWLNGVDANSTWHANFVSGDVLKIQFKTLKTGDAIMILYTPRSTVLKRVMVL